MVGRGPNMPKPYLKIAKTIQTHLLLDFKDLLTLLLTKI